MKKGFKFYLIAWAIMFILFNAAVYFLPQEFTLLGVTYEKLGSRSWVTLIVLEMCFLLHLVLTMVALNQKKLSGTFYRLPLIRISYSCVVMTLILGVLAMLVFIPSWIPLALAILVVVFYVIALLKVGAMVKLVEKVDRKTETKTAFIKMLTIDANTLINRSKSEPVKAVCKKVYEAVRYSDPMSADALSDVESSIRTEFNALTGAVLTDDVEAVKTTADELLTLIQERNQRCRAEK